MNITKKRLQQALDGLAKAHNRAFIWRDIVAKYSEQNFGVDPSDVDFDSFIDACDGGGGMCCGMSADEFISGMREILDEKEINDRLKSHETNKPINAGMAIRG